MTTPQALSFTTSLIYFSNSEELQNFADSLKGVRVDAFNFSNSDNEAKDNAERKLDLGNALCFNINKDNHSMIIASPGGLLYYDVSDYDANSGKVPNLKNLLDTVFDFKFFQRNPNLEITIEARDIKGVSATNTIKLSEHHSQEEYEKRIASELSEIQDIKKVINSWQERLDTLKAKHRKTHMALDTIIRNNALDQAF